MSLVHYTVQEEEFLEHTHFKSCRFCIVTFSQLADHSVTLGMNLITLLNLPMPRC